MADVDKIRVQDIFDMDFLQKFQDSYARAVGMSAVTVDADGKPITRPTDWTDFCMKCTRDAAARNVTERAVKLPPETVAHLCMNVMLDLWILGRRLC